MSARRSRRSHPEILRSDLEDLIRNFKLELESPEIRTKVRALIPAFHMLRDLGSSLTEDGSATAARDRILLYFRAYPLTLIDGDEIMVVAGIQDWPRRVRELRVELGWKIVTGTTITQMRLNGDDILIEEADLDAANSDCYMLLDLEADRDAAYRWNTANTIRKSSASVSTKILEFLLANVGIAVTGEELRYIAKGKTEWARRTRELRTEQGWPLVTKNSGRPDLKIGDYLLESERQSPEHDRHMRDEVRRDVLRRDEYRCQRKSKICGWHHEQWNRSDPRHLEIHHIEEHVAGGSNEEGNLITLCTVCHDSVHAGNPL